MKKEKYDEQNKKEMSIGRKKKRTERWRRKIKRENVEERGKEE